MLLCGVIGEEVEILRGAFLPAPLLQAPPHPPNGFMREAGRLRKGLKGVVGCVDQNALGRILKALIILLTGQKGPP